MKLLILKKIKYITIMAAVILLAVSGCSKKTSDMVSPAEDAFNAVGKTDR